MSTNSILELCANSPFVGTIYAPNADCTISSSTGSATIFGSVLVKSLRLNSHLELHYDEDLPRR